MRKELQQIQAKVRVDETLLTVDALVGQNATNVALAFAKQIKITGLVRTKLDGDSRGGAALSIKKLTGLPIKYAGLGEKRDDLQNFHPERRADRILGRGDIVSLVEERQEKIDEKQAEKTSRRMAQGQFDRNDRLSMRKQINKLGSLKRIRSRVPNRPSVSDEQMDQAEARRKKTQVISNSRNRQERKKPEIIKSNRKIRIAKGSGTSPKEVTAILTAFEQRKGQRKNRGRMGGFGGMGGRFRRRK